MEILAPVGGWEQLEAAVRAGANAVYLGAKGFNARRNAQNFDAQGLQQAVRYCHGRGVAVHVTVNTLVMDGEERALVEQAGEIARAGADAVIVQDLAAAQVFHRLYPDIALHGSTQMSIHNAAGAQMLQDLGFARAVLARELSREEIRTIHEKTGIELEIFVHGALCMSVSGQCYLSCLLGGRSGNRGLCAQPCRLDFQAGGRRYALSLKDLSLLEDMQAVQDTGVCSLKIEGRMKRPEYVAAAVHACRQALQGETPDMEMLETVFSRGGFTQGYFDGRRDGRMFGRRSKEDAQAAKSVYGALSALYRNEYPGVPVDMHFTARAEEPLCLTVSDGVRDFTATGEAPQAAQKREAGREDVQKNLEKTGGTPFYLKNLEIQLDGGLFLPAAALNALRRAALEGLLVRRSETGAKEKAPAAALPALPPQRAGAQRPGLRVCLADISQLSPALLAAEKIHLPLFQITPELLSSLGEKLVGELPVLTFPGEEAALEQRMQTLRAAGLQAVCGHNIAAVLQARRTRLHLFGGYGLNIANRRALAVYRALGVEDCTLSFELSARQAADLVSGPPVGILAYGHLPLMQLRSCPNRGEHGCGACQGDAAVRDRKGVDFPLWCHEKRYSTLLNPDVLYLADKMPQGLDFALLYFTRETAADCARVLAAYAAGESAPEGGFTRGMYNKSLL